VKDQALEEYASAIEEHLGACRGASHVLSPRDFALARAWHASRVPLVTVLAGIDLACQDGAAPTSLVFCRARVESLVATFSGAAAERPPVRGIGMGEVRDRLAALLGALSRQEDRQARLALEPARARCQDLLDQLTVSARPNWDWVARKLEAVDDLVSEGALQVVGEERRALFRAEAARALERQRGRVDDRALAQAALNYETSRAREVLELPRVRVDV
jgi:hypothetical protein